MLCMHEYNIYIYICMSIYVYDCVCVRALIMDLLFFCFTHVEDIYIYICMHINIQYEVCARGCAYTTVLHALTDALLSYW